jgi:hypothetical protein
MAAKLNRYYVFASGKNSNKVASTRRTTVGACGLQNAFQHIYLFSIHSNMQLVIHSRSRTPIVTSTAFHMAKRWLQHELVLGY